MEALIKESGRKGTPMEPENTLIQMGTVTKEFGETESESRKYSISKTMILKINQIQSNTLDINLPPVNQVR